MAAATTAALIMAGTALATTGAQMEMSRQASSKAEKQDKENRLAQEKLIKDEEDRNQSTDAALQARARQKALGLAPASGGRSDTILTSALGVPGAGVSGAPKTLLGS